MNLRFFKSLLYEALGALLITWSGLFMLVFNSIGDTWPVTLTKWALFGAMWVGGRSLIIKGYELE